MPVTQKDIAKELNLSQSTVTKVLNNRPDVWVSSENRQRILLMAKKLNYRPNQAARALRSGQFKSVTFTFIRPTNDFLRVGYSYAVEVLAERLGEIGYELKVKVFPTQNLLMRSLEQLAGSRDTDAVILWGDDVSVDEQAALLQREELPFVVKGRFERAHPDWKQVDFDHEGMMAASVRRVVELGHKNVAYIGNSMPDIYNERLLSGFLNEMRTHGLSVPDGLTAQGEPTTEFAQACMENWLAMAPEERPTALIVGTGNLAWQAAENVLALHGRRIGEKEGEFTVVGTSIGSFSLSFGEAHAFQSLAFENLAEAMFEHILKPILEARPVTVPVVRILPQLAPLPSLDQLRYVQFRT